jgi:hypothetical protein
LRVSRNPPQSSDPRPAEWAVAVPLRETLHEVERRGAAR